MNFKGRFVWTNDPFALCANGPQSSPKVSPETGIGPWIALPSILIILGGIKPRKKEPCPSFPWCFRFLGVFLAGKFLGLLRVFCLFCPGFLRVRKVTKILGVFEGFPCYFQKDQGKEGQGRVCIV